MDAMRRRSFLTRMTLGAAALAATSRGGAAAFAGTESPPDGLAEPAFRPLPLGAITAGGWLLRQLRIQADGLSGHLDELWPDVAESQWFGGNKEGWERAPYWLDGVVPLAFVLGDERLLSKVHRRVGQIVASQRPDGWYAPCRNDASGKPYDLWAVLLVDKVLVQYHEATGDAATLDAVVRSLRALHAALRETPLFGWGRFRWFEGLVSTYYAFERTHEPWLLDLSRLLRVQGFDYLTYYAGDDVTSPTPRRGRWTFEKHVVNTAMALKAHALSWRLTRLEEERSFPARMLVLLDRYHGQVTGMFTGDECLAGRNPVQGTELCAVVEALYSLEVALAVTGDTGLGDRLERIAFNALPATLAPDMWSHQYDQQVNQVQCTVNPDHMWTTNGPESNIFGLEPNFGCCTANMHQGWPKLAAHLIMRSWDGGIAVAAYAPATARCEVAGTPVRLDLETDYPFRQTLRLTVRAERPVRFPLYLRVPGWASAAFLHLSDGATQRLESGSFHRLEQEWGETTKVELLFGMPVRISRRYHQAVAIERGPLVYSLPIGESWTRVNADKPGRELPHGDFEVRPTTAWNYGLRVDEKWPDNSITFEERPVGERPFSAEGAGVVAHVEGRRLPEWKLRNGWADEVPPVPEASSEPLEKLTLVPYGCARLRITEFPRLAG
jgi:uncharacterized protein